MAEINVTPLVDVMLVLLIIFMITAPMLNNAGVAVELPQSESPPLPMEEEQQLVLSMTADRKVFINENEDTAFELDELLPRLRAIAEANPEQPVFLRADGSLAYRDVVGLLDLAKRAGMPKVGLVFDPTTAVESPE